MAPWDERRGIQLLRSSSRVARLASVSSRTGRRSAKPMSSPLRQTPLSWRATRWLPGLSGQDRELVGRADEGVREGRAFDSDDAQVVLDVGRGFGQVEGLEVVADLDALVESLSP